MVLKKKIIKQTYFKPSKTNIRNRLWKSREGVKYKKKNIKLLTKISQMLTIITNTNYQTQVVLEALKETGFIKVKTNKYTKNLMIFNN